MKRFILLVLVVVFLPVTTAHAQVTIIAAPIMDAILAMSYAEQVIYYAKSLVEMVTTAEQTVHMVENMGKQIQKQVENLSNIGNIHSYQDFMDWHNRQLYLKRMTEETFTNMNVTIGKNNYKLTDVEGIAYGLKDTYVDYWNKEFTEEQRREMWVNLGVTPANYAYIQTWKALEQQIAREFLAARAIHNKEYQKNMEQDKKNTDALVNDKLKDPDDPTKMGDKGIAVINAETNIASNKILNNIDGRLADMQEKQAIEIYQRNTPSDEPPMSAWKKDGVKSMKKYKEK